MKRMICCINSTKKKHVVKANHICIKASRRKVYRCQYMDLVLRQTMSYSTTRIIGDDIAKDSKNKPSSSPRFSIELKELQLTNCLASSVDGRSTSRPAL